MRSARWRLKAGNSKRSSIHARWPRQRERRHQDHQHTALAQVSHEVASLLEALARVQDGDQQLRRLQETLNQNLATLAGAGTVVTLDAGGIAASAPVVTGGVEGPVAGSWPFTRADGCPMLGPWAWAPAACDVAAAPTSA